MELGVQGDMGPEIYICRVHLPVGNTENNRHRASWQACEPSDSLLANNQNGSKLELWLWMMSRKKTLEKFLKSFIKYWVCMVGPQKEFLLFYALVARSQQCYWVFLSCKHAVQP